MTPLLLGCTASAPAVPDVAMTTVGIEMVDGTEAIDNRLLDLIEGAERSISIALPAVENEALAQALVGAAESGVDVRVVTDVDRSADAGVALLQEAPLELALADGGTAYFDFAINDDVEWTSEQVIMSHAFALVDDTRILNASTAGIDRPGHQWLWTATSEDLGEDLWSEHNQVMGGSDASSLTAFSSLAKSTADSRWIYPTQSDVHLEVWFGPQQRLTKRIIDAIYSARASVWVLTDDFANEGLARALQAKAQDGFEVEVVVGPRFRESARPLSEVLEDECPDVAKWRVTADIEVPTVVLIDYELARDDRRYTARAFTLSHDIYAAERLYAGKEVLTDQLIDGNLWVLDDTNEPSPELETLRELYVALKDQGEEL